jgi:light-regulated signal transduction histidine kinase (bacteriophytochrome)
MALASAEGAAVVSGGHSWLIGKTPSEDEVQRLFDWLSLHHREDVFATNALGQVFPEAEAYAIRRAGCWRSRSPRSIRATCSGFAPRWSAP